MQRATGIVAVHQLVETFLLSSRLSLSPARSLHFHTTRYSQLLPLITSSQNDFLNTHHHHHHHHHQKVCFSSNPNSILQLLTTTKDWSKDLETQLEKSNPTTPLTHELVSYVLMNLERAPQKALDFFKWVSEKQEFKPSSLVYGMMLRILCNKETIHEFWGLTKKMSDQGLAVDERTYILVSGNLNNLKMVSDATAWYQFFNETKSAADATVKPLVDVMLESDWNKDVEKKLGELTKVALSENCVLRIFWALQRHPLKGLCFFRWLKEQMGYTHNAVTYNAILRVLGKEESIEEFWSMVEELKSEGHDIDIDTYSKISRQFQRVKMLKYLVQLYELMIDGPYKPPAKDSTFIIRNILAIDTSDVDLLSRIVKKYEATGHTLSKDSYDWMYRSFTGVGKLDEAEKVLDTMTSVGFEPDHLTYSHGVFVLCKAGKVEEAIKMLDEMESKGCVPDMNTWNFITRGFCIALEIDKVLKCFNKMKEKNFDVDASLLEDLVNTLCTKKKVDTAYTLVIRSIADINLRPSLSTYKSLITKLLRERKLEEATNLLSLMKGHDFHTSTVYQSLEHQVCNGIV